VESLKTDYKLKYVLNSKSETYEADLKQLCADLKPKVLIDAIGGETTGATLKLMGKSAIAIVYGLLDSSNVGNIDPMRLIAMQQKVEGFVISAYLSQFGLLKRLSIVNEAKALLT
jgi:NADPH-dependent curcumin reductase CurA